MAYGNVAAIATDGQHFRTQCCRHNGSSFCLGLSLCFLFASVNYTWMPNHQVWKQKGEEYRIFAGGGWVWTSGLQLRNRKRTAQDTTDSFPAKKRKLGEVVDTIYARKEAKRRKKEAEEREKELKAKAAAIAYQPVAVMAVSTVATCVTAVGPVVATSAVPNPSALSALPASCGTGPPHTETSSVTTLSQASAGNSTVTFAVQTTESATSRATLPNPPPVGASLTASTQTSSAAVTTTPPLTSLVGVGASPGATEQMQRAGSTSSLGLPSGAVSTSRLTSVSGSSTVVPVASLLASGAVPPPATLQAVSTPSPSSRSEVTTVSAIASGSAPFPDAKASPDITRGGPSTEILEASEAIGARISESTPLLSRVPTSAVASSAISPTRPPLSLPSSDSGSDSSLRHPSLDTNNSRKSPVSASQHDVSCVNASPLSNVSISESSAASNIFSDGADTNNPVTTISLPLSANNPQRLSISAEAQPNCDIPSSNSSATHFVASPIVSDASRSVETPSQSQSVKGGNAAGDMEASLVSTSDCPSQTVIGACSNSVTAHATNASSPLDQVAEAKSTSLDSSCDSSANVPSTAVSVPSSTETPEQMETPRSVSNIIAKSTSLDSSCDSSAPVPSTAVSVPSSTETSEQMKTPRSVSNFVQAASSLEGVLVGVNENGEDKGRMVGRSVNKELADETQRDSELVPDDSPFLVDTCLLSNEKMLESSDISVGEPSPSHSAKPHEQVPAVPSNGALAVVADAAKACTGRESQAQENTPDLKGKLRAAQCDAMQCDSESQDETACTKGTDASCVTAMEIQRTTPDVEQTSDTNTLTPDLRRTLRESQDETACTEGTAKAADSEGTVDASCVTAMEIQRTTLDVEQTSDSNTPAEQESEGHFRPVQNEQRSTTSVSYVGSEHSSQSSVDVAAAHPGLNPGAGDITDIVGFSPEETSAVNVSSDPSGTTDGTFTAANDRKKATSQLSQASCRGRSSEVERFEVHNATCALQESQASGSAAVKRPTESSDKPSNEQCVPSDVPTVNESARSDGSSEKKEGETILLNVTVADEDCIPEEGHHQQTAVAGNSGAVEQLENPGVLTVVSVTDTPKERVDSEPTGSSVVEMTDTQVKRAGCAETGSSNMITTDTPTAKEMPAVTGSTVVTADAPGASEVSMEAESSKVAKEMPVETGSTVVTTTDEPGASEVPMEAESSIVAKEMPAGTGPTVVTTTDEPGASEVSMEAESSIVAKEMPVETGSTVVSMEDAPGASEASMEAESSIVAKEMPAGTGLTVVTTADAPVEEERSQDKAGPLNGVVTDATIESEVAKEQACSAIVSKPNATLSVDGSKEVGAVSNAPLQTAVTVCPTHGTTAGASDDQHNDNAIVSGSSSAIPNVAVSVATATQNHSVATPQNPVVPSPITAVAAASVHPRNQAASQGPTPATVGQPVLRSPVNAALHPTVKSQSIRPQLPKGLTMPTATRTILPRGQVSIPPMPNAVGAAGLQPAGQGTPVGGIAALVASISTANSAPGQPQVVRLVAPSGASVTLETVQQALASLQQKSLLKPGSTTVTLNFAQNPVPGAVQPSSSVGASGVRAVAPTAGPAPSAAAAVGRKTPLVALRRMPTQDMPPFTVIKDPKKLLAQIISKWPKRQRVRSIFRLDKKRGRILGRKAGMKEVEGFLYK